MAPIKIILHSITDLITNSSTVIFTYSNSSLEPLKELINEIFSLFRPELTFDDVFVAEVFLDDSGYYINYYEENYQEENADTLEIDQLLEMILFKKISKPDWIKEAEEYYETQSTSLYLGVKDLKYQSLADKLILFLYSPNHEAEYD